MSDFNEPVNIGNPIELSVKEMAVKILKETGSSSDIVYHPLPKDDPKVRRPDISLAKKHLNWEPRVTLEEGLSQTISYFRQTISV